MSYDIQKENGKELNKLYEKDLAIHNWYRFVLSFPPHLVRKYLEEFQLSKDSCILDPFCGTGTTLVEAKKNNIKSIGFEANPVVRLCAATKVNWDINTKELLLELSKIKEQANKAIKYKKDNLIKLDSEKEKLIIKNSISDIPLHKVLILIDVINSFNSEFDDFYKTALAKQIVFSFSNLKFGPEVGVSKKKKNDMDVINLWYNQVKEMVSDLDDFKDKNIFSKVILGDSRNNLSLIDDNSIDAVITSPPYPNEKDYSRTTRLESVLLGFIKNKEDLRKLKKMLLRSNTRGVYKEDNDMEWIKNNKEVNDLSNKIEEKRLELGKTSGFEKLYHKVVKLYFGGMTKHLNDLKPKLKNGAKLAYVVGDQYSYFRIPIKTGEIISNIAKELGYTVIRIDLFRTRFSTATKENVNEEIVLLEYNYESK